MLSNNFRVGDRVSANPEVWQWHTAGTVVEICMDCCKVEWDSKDVSPFPASESCHSWFNHYNLIPREEKKMTKFRIGSIVCPMWDKDRRGKVTGYINESLVSVRWFPDPVYQESTESWHESNLVFVTPKDNAIRAIKCKPIESTYPIAGGDWRYVVINTLQDEAVAAFVNHEDAEDYVDSDKNSGTFMIREIDNS